MDSLNGAGACWQWVASWWQLHRGGSSDAHSAPSNWQLWALTLIAGWAVESWAMRAVPGPKTSGVNLSSEPLSVVFPAPICKENGGSTDS